MIYVECKPDAHLVQTLSGLGKKKVRHESNKSEICKRLEKEREVAALIDEDPQSPKESYLRTLETNPKLLRISKYHLKIFADKKDNTVIVLSPRLEGWILKIARANKVDPKNFDLPDNENRLHEIINNKLDKFELLINALKRSEAFKMLAKTLKGSTR